MKLWIARDKAENNKGIVCLFTKKPIFYAYHENQWHGEGELYLGRDVFPEVTFENSPKEVELNLL